MDSRSAKHNLRLTHAGLVILVHGKLESFGLNSSRDINHQGRKRPPRCMQYSASGLPGALRVMLGVLGGWAKRLPCEEGSAGASPTDRM